MRDLASLCSLIGRDLFAVPIFCKDIVFVLLEPPDSGIDWNLNRGKRNLAPGHISNLFLQILNRIGKEVFFLNFQQPWMPFFPSIEEKSSRLSNTLWGTFVSFWGALLVSTE